MTPDGFEATFRLRIDATAIDGGMRGDRVREGGLASQLGLDDGDLLVTLAGAPVASLDDLVTVLRLVDTAGMPAAEWIRSGSLLSAQDHGPI